MPGRVRGVVLSLLLFGLENVGCEVAIGEYNKLEMLEV